MAEHKCAVCRGVEQNGIAVHVHQLQHCIDWESANVLILIDYATLPAL